MKATDFIPTEQFVTLEAKVFGNNLINELSKKNLKKVLPQIEAIFKDNKKFILASGTACKSCNIKMIEAENFRAYLSYSNGSIWLEARVNIAGSICRGGGYCFEYFKRELYIGRYYPENGFIKELEPIDKIISNWGLNKKYTVKGISAKLEKLEALKGQVSTITNEIRNFV